MGKLRRTLCALLLVTVSFTLYACSSSKKTSYCDDNFIQTMADGLTKRWADNTDEDKITNGSDEHEAYYKKLVSYEYDSIKEYKDKKFKDSKLQEMALQYINQLKAQKNSLKYMQVDYDKFDKLWMEAYDERTKLIVEINDKYKLPIDSKYKKELSNMKTNAKEVESDEKLKKTLDEMVAKAKMKVVKDEYGSATYKIILTNKTGKDFSYFNITAKLKDSDNVIVDTPTGSVNSWSNGDTAKFEIYTDEKFKSYELTYDYNLKEE